MDILFLDANVLFSAAYRDNSGLLHFWKIPKAQLITSLYAVEEARRNLHQPEQIERLETLLNDVEFIPTERIHADLPKEITLRAKDRPILAAAIAAKAHYLITGDIKDFGKYYGKRIAGVKILPPSEYLELHKKKE